jgi:subtilase family serine protease
MKYIKVFVLMAAALVSFVLPARAAYHFSNYRGKPPIHILKTTGKKPAGMTPSQIKKIYDLPENAGQGTIAIIGAYDDSSVEKDLNDFSKEFGLSSCTGANVCFEKHAMKPGMKNNSGWALETSLDVEWAHAVAPMAKILLVEAATPSGANLLKAVDYAAARGDVVSVSMSWGGAEFPEEISLDEHFKSKNNAAFFASSGDSGWGASWPAASPNVIGVGGTTLALKSDGTLMRETAWAGSGGGVSAYEKMPSYQADYSIPKALGMRAIPDVSYDADPKSGFPIVRLGVWRTVGGTSAGAPQWAAIAAMSAGTAANRNFYTDKASDKNGNYFRDIVSGSNGDCGYYCAARRRYDYVTGLGSPVTANF